MTNLVSLLPGFDLGPYSHILPSLERALISTADLLTLDALDIAKRAQVPPGEVKKLTSALTDTLNANSAVGKPFQASAIDGWSGFENVDRLVARRRVVSTLDDDLDIALHGGIAAGHLTEIVGESAVGKTQFLLHLLLSAQLLPSNGTANTSTMPSALYISTEAPLQTTRLSQILNTHPKLTALSPTERPNLNRVHSTHVHDVEAQEHILRFQVPVAVQKHHVSLVVIDSIAANYRAEFDKGVQARKTFESLAQRSAQLAQLGSLLRTLARTHNIAVVVANQVADRFSVLEPPLLHQPSQSTQSTRMSSPRLPTSTAPAVPSNPLLSVFSTDDPLAIDHQQRFFTGWGDDPSVTTNLKTPSLGLTWTNQLATRIALLKEPIYAQRVYAPGDEREIIGWTRTCKIVFSASAPTSTTSFEIWRGGIRSVAKAEKEASPLSKLNVYQ